LRYVPHSIGGAIVAPVKESCGRLLILGTKTDNLLSGYPFAGY